MSRDQRHHYYNNGDPHNFNDLTMANNLRQSPPEMNNYRNRTGQLPTAASLAYQPMPPQAAAPLNDYNLLMSLVGGSYAPANSTYQSQITQQYPQYHQAQPPQGMYTSPLGAGTYDPLPLHTTQEHASAHQRHSSFDDYLQLSPSLFSGIDSGPLPPLLSLSYTQATKENSDSQTQTVHNGDERILSEIALEIPSIVEQPMNGIEIVARCQSRVDDIWQRYIPCVLFLVQCQQELRQALNVVTQSKTYNRRNPMTTKQFYTIYLEPLDSKFYRALTSSGTKVLHDAVVELGKLKADAREFERNGCDAMKSAFLGGMKEGESWGLRKWMAKNGNGLQISTDLEIILRAVKGLDRHKKSTQLLAQKLRNMSQQILSRLRSDVPKAYQEKSAAHPFLPFFHRIEAVLQNMSTHDPSQDDIICLDDSDDDEPAPIEQPRPPPTRKREVDYIELLDSPCNKKACVSSGSNANSREEPGKISLQQRVPSPPNSEEQFGETAVEIFQNQEMEALHTEAIRLLKPLHHEDVSSSGESDAGSGIDVVNPQQPCQDNIWTCSFCSAANVDYQINCLDCGRKNRASVGKLSVPTTTLRAAILWMPNRDPILDSVLNSVVLSLKLLASYFEKGQEHILEGHISFPARAQQGFWKGYQFGKIVSIFESTIKRKDAQYLLRPFDDEFALQNDLPRYADIIKNPICFMDIANALLRSPDKFDGTITINTGSLPCSLDTWNMWNGEDLLQAVDLVMINSLGYSRRIGAMKSVQRRSILSLRHKFWCELDGLVLPCTNGNESERKRILPVKRKEDSGFVVYNNSNVS